MLYKIGICLYYKCSFYLHLFMLWCALIKLFWVRLGVLIDISKLRLEADKMHIYYSKEVV